MVRPSFDQVDYGGPMVVHQAVTGRYSVSLTDFRALSEQATGAEPELLAVKFYHDVVMEHALAQMIGVPQELLEARHGTLQEAQELDLLSQTHSRREVDRIRKLIGMKLETGD